ncbi:MAG TPA: cytochrome c [Hyphomicrobiaceae bacterium]|jgi:mono/diheme cytochrome c family protein
MARKRRSALGILIKLLALLLIAGGAALYLLTIPSTLPPSALPQRTADLANGEVMFHAGGCASCHSTPGQEDKTRLGGGLELKTAFGTFHAPNISPDPQHGIGGWSEIAFVNAMLRGVGRDGEHLYPSFPYTSYQRMTLDDVRDLFAFIKTLPAEAKPSIPHELQFPFNVRRAVGLWKLIYLDGRSFEPDPAQDSVVNRGAYLVEGPGHCAECHSQRDALGGIIPERRFAGGPNPTGKGWVPNITPHEDGLASWSAGDIAYLLESGFTPDYDSVGSSMADVVANTSKLSADDRAAMAAYLKSLPPRPGKRQSSN